MLGTAAAMLAALWLFVAAVDPWGVLPVHLPMRRAAVGGNARVFLPMVARAAAFDAAIVGSSTSRELPPAMLDRVFAPARFANLAFNAATWREQMAMLRLFLRHHRAPRAVAVGLDRSWCNPETVRAHHPMPPWMYGGSPWWGYAHLLSVAAIGDAVGQAAIAAGWKRAAAGADGYADFLPPDAAWDAARVRRNTALWGPVNAAPAAGPADLPGLPVLFAALRALPGETVRVLWFPPARRAMLGAPGSQVAAEWAACKARTVAAARAMPGATVVDFAFPDAVTERFDLWWDPLHYRVVVRDRIVADLGRALAGQGDPDGLGRVLVAPSEQQAGE